MNKDKFLYELDNALKVLTKDERFDILQDYEEHFELGLEAGKTEEEVAASLGSPTQIARELLATYSVNQDYAEPKSPKGTGERVIRSGLVLVMLFFFNLFFAIWIPITVFLTLCALWLVAIVLLVAPILVIGNAIIHTNVFAWFDIFFSLGMCGVGYFLGLGLWYLTKLSTKATLWYVKLNMKLIKGE